VFIRKILTAMLLLMASINAFSQQKIYQVRGSLTDTEGKAVQFAHVVNINKRAACISDTAGRFRVLMLKNDTIKISCLGYDISGFTISGLNLDDDTSDNIIEIGNIVLKEKTYELEMISVYKERWKSFVYDWQQEEPEETPYYEKKIEHWKTNLVEINELKQLATASRGVGFGMGFLFDRKQRKAMEKVNEDKRQETLNKEAEAKYNPEIVAEITGMSIDEARKFMDHFKLDRDFILRRNDYDLYLIIKQLYKEYKK